MDTLIKNGDFALDVCGLPKSVKSIDEACQRVRFILTTRKGSYVYDRNLGSDFSALKDAENKERTAWLLCKEALVGQGEIDIGFVHITDSSTILAEVLYKGLSSVVEVNYSANV